MDLVGSGYDEFGRPATRINAMTPPPTTPRNPSIVMMLR